MVNDVQWWLILVIVGWQRSVTHCLSGSHLSFPLLFNISSLSLVAYHLRGGYAFFERLQVSSLPLVQHVSGKGSAIFFRWGWNHYSTMTKWTKHSQKQTVESKRFHCQWFTQPSLVPRWYSPKSSLKGNQPAIAVLTQSPSAANCVRSGGGN